MWHYLYTEDRGVIQYQAILPALFCNNSKIININRIQINLDEIIVFIIYHFLGHRFYYVNFYTKSEQYLCQFAQKMDFVSWTVIGWT